MPVVPRATQDSHLCEHLVLPDLALPLVVAVVCARVLQHLLARISVGCFEYHMLVIALASYSRTGERDLFVVASATNAAPSGFLKGSEQRYICMRLGRDRVGQMYKILCNSLTSQSKFVGISYASMFFVFKYIWAT